MMNVHEVARAKRTRSFICIRAMELSESRQHRPRQGREPHASGAMELSGRRAYWNATWLSRFWVPGAVASGPTTCAVHGCRGERAERGGARLEGLAAGGWRLARGGGPRGVHLGVDAKRAPALSPKCVRTARRRLIVLSTPFATTRGQDRYIPLKRTWGRRMIADCPMVRWDLQTENFTLAGLVADCKVPCLCEVTMFR